MTRRPTFWLLFAALGLAGAVTATLLFSRALPSISVDIEMDRTSAVDSAAALATRYGWGESDDRSAATFGLADDLVQTFVELEGGGPEVVEELADEDVYEAYQWRVRRFAEGRVEEALVRFTPDGEPHGFRLRLAEGEPGDGNVAADEARVLAEATAEEWGVDLELFELSESSSETLPGGRVDHAFVYERAGARIGDTPFLLRLGVAGQRPSEVTHFVRVPEAFSRQYADMRSTNDAIALVAQGVLLLIFVLLGAGVGSALLLRQRWLEWRKPLVWGGAIALAFGAASVNRLPLSWNSYDTALSSSSFVMQQVAGGLAIAILGTPLLAFFLMAGESLGRKAFPGHVQQWRFWSPQVASSSTALGMTVAAYLLVGLQVGYVVLFYLGTGELEGWWSPADALVQPDLLATYLPWLEAVSLAFFASFWEEAVFRAVPIACAALVGARYGRREVWVWGAVLLQALVFAAGHANYPQQPPYARVIELMAPALLWGAVYVRFGLVPTILAHFLYDLVLMSIVLFEANALLDQGVIVVVGLAPLGVVLAMRARYGARPAPPAWAYNGAWTPPGADLEGPDPSEAEGTAVDVVVEAAPPDSEDRAPDGPDPSRSDGVPSAPAELGFRGWVVGLVGTVGAISLVAGLIVRAPIPRLEGDRASAVAAALDELRARGVEVDAWRVHVTTTSGDSQGRRYVFEEAGQAAFDELEGSYFGRPHWVVRLVDWEAEPAERVEEYRVWVGPGSEVSRLAHTVPEGRPGASLAMDEARASALGAISAAYGLAPGDVTEVEAVETDRPARTDWLFTFSEVGPLSDVEGEVQVRVGLAGDEVVDVRRSVDVPEEWERDRRRAQNRAAIMTGGLGLLLLVGFVTAAVTAVVVWSRRGLPKGTLWKLTSVAFVALLASSLNDWPLTAASFTTAQPWGFQAAATGMALALVAFVAAPAIGLVASLAQGWLGESRSGRSPTAAGVAFGALIAGLSLAGGAMLPRPEIGSYTPAASFLPVLGPALGVVPAFLLVACALLVAVALRERFAHQPWVRTTLWSLLVATAVVLVPPELQASAPTWAVGGVCVAALLGVGLYASTIRPIVVPALVATVFALRSLGSAWSPPYPGARLGELIAAVALAALAWWWTREIARAGEEPAA